MTIEITDANYEQITKGLTKPIILEFGAEAWCSPCRTLAPILEELSEEFKDDVIIGKVNVDDNVALAQKFGVRSIPAVFLLKADLTEADRFVGMLAKTEIIKKIEKLKTA